MNRFPGFTFNRRGINRWNVTLSGLVVPPSWSPGVLGNAVAATYVPSWTEVAVSIGVVGYATLAFTLGRSICRCFRKRLMQIDC